MSPPPGRPSQNMLWNTSTQGLQRRRQQNEKQDVSSGGKQLEDSNQRQCMYTAVHKTVYVFNQVNLIAASQASKIKSFARLNRFINYLDGWILGAEMQCHFEPTLQ